jgi:hypothetical protein
MSNDGKPLEKTIQLIEETFKDSENTQIFRNHKIKDNDGIKREFDVLIKTIVNGYDIYIAIECKDYGTKVSIDRIDGFKTKCDSVKEISKRIFVSKNGFQKGAEIKAKTYGIELLTAEEVNADYLENLMPNILQFNMEITKISEEYKTTVKTKDLNLLVEISSILTSYFIDGKTQKQKNVFDIIIQAINDNSVGIQNLALQHFIKHKDKYDNKPTILTIDFGVDFPSGEFYVEHEKLQPIEVLRLDFWIQIKFNSLNTEPTGRIIKNLDESIKAHSMKFHLAENIESEIIITPDNDFSFYYTEKNETTKLKKLFVYDSKTNELQRPKLSFNTKN